MKKNIDEIEQIEYYYINNNDDNFQLIKTIKVQPNVEFDMSGYVYDQNLDNNKLKLRIELDSDELVSEIEHNRDINNPTYQEHTYFKIKIHTKSNNSIKIYGVNGSGGGHEFNLYYTTTEFNKDDINHNSFKINSLAKKYYEEKIEKNK